MASSQPVSTLIERDVEHRVKFLVHSIHGLIRACEDPSVVKNRDHLDWRVATLRDALEALEQVAPKRPSKPKMSRDQRDIQFDVARSLEQELEWRK